MAFEKRLSCRLSCKSERYRLNSREFLLGQDNSFRWFHSPRLHFGEIPYYAPTHSMSPNDRQGSLRTRCMVLGVSESCSGRGLTCSGGPSLGSPLRMAGSPSRRCYWRLFS
jgi:hypothetical protein